MCVNEDDDDGNVCVDFQNGQVLYDVNYDLVYNISNKTISTSTITRNSTDKTMLLIFMPLSNFSCRLKLCLEMIVFLKTDLHLNPSFLPTLHHLLFFTGSFLGACEVCLWDMSTLRMVTVIKGYHAIAFDRSGRYLALGGARGEMCDGGGIGAVLAADDDANCDNDHVAQVIRECVKCACGT